MAAHEGLRAAIRKTLQGASWQRCRVHYIRNLLSTVPKGSQEMVAAAFRSIFTLARTPTTATLAQAVENRDVLIGEDKRDPVRFHLVWTIEMGAGRKSGSRSPGFIDSMLNLIESFYGSVVQSVTPWTPKAPKISGPSTTEP